MNAITKIASRTQVARFASQLALALELYLCMLLRVLSVLSR